MAQLKFGGPGVRTREIDLTGRAPRAPIGVPAGVIGTSLMGPAFTPVTVGDSVQLFSVFGPTDGRKAGPLAGYEWLKNAGALTYVRVLGAGNGLQRLTATPAGTVASAGFVVGENEPSGSDGTLAPNPFANGGGEAGRAYFLGCFMSESAGSTYFSSTGLQGDGSVTPGVNTSLPIIRGVLFAASGVIPRLSSSSEGANGAPLHDFIAGAATATGSALGAVVLLDNSTPKQEFVLLLNGHAGNDPAWPNVYTASFDMTAPNYLANVFNTDPLQLNAAGHYLYSHWDVHPAAATVTGSGLIVTTSGAFGLSASRSGAESAAFLLSGSLARNLGSTTVPDYENWEDRYSSASTPWVTSQRLGGHTVDLFRLVALHAGAGQSTRFKVSIENIVQSTDLSYTYCSFDVVLRTFSDNDSEPLIIEQFRGVNLDPTSNRYISRIIGDVNRFFDFDVAELDQRLVVEGSYANASNIVRVEVATIVDDGTLDPSAVPFGFRGPMHIVTSGSAPLQSVSTTQLLVANATKRAVEPPLPYRMSIAVGSGSRAQADALLYWGVHFEHVTDFTDPNTSVLHNSSVDAYAAFYPSQMTAWMNFAAGSETVGALITDANGIVDADRFCYNAFTLSNIRVVTGSNGLADPEQWSSATYVRNGVIPTNSTAKTRALTPDDLTNANRRFAKFTMIMQGGFDGVNVFDSDEASITDAAVAADMAASNRGTTMGPSVRAYQKAIAIMGDPTAVDVQLLAIPGIRQPIVTDTAISAVESRVDALYLMEPINYDATDAIVPDGSSTPVSPLFSAQEFSNRALNSSFAAAYFPDIIMVDPTTRTNVLAPPSVAALAALALNDAVGRPWLAPAGKTRGAIVDGVEPSVILSQEQIDLLYDSLLNPIISFPAPELGGIALRSGAVVWGQKTLLSTVNSAFDRINVRRLLIAIRRIVRRVVLQILFEPNRESTLAAFTAKINPQLQRIQTERGLNGYKVIVDSTTTTQADIENNTVRGKILLAPTKSTEFISIDFTVTNGGMKG